VEKQLNYQGKVVKMLFEGNQSTTTRI